MEKKYTSNEEEQQDNILREPAISYGKYAEEEMETLPPLTEEEEKELITGDELLEAVCKHIHELFNKK